LRALTSEWQSESTRAKQAQAMLATALPGLCEKTEQLVDIAAAQEDTIARLRVEVATAQEACRAKDAEIAQLKTSLEAERARPAGGDEKLRALSRVSSGALGTEELAGLETALRDYLEAVRVAKEKKLRDLQTASQCKICYEREADALFLACNHLFCCMHCAEPLK
jgi:hypothetical protein